MHENVRYNCRVVCLNQQILLIRPKVCNCVTVHSSPLRLGGCRAPAFTFAPPIAHGTHTLALFAKTREHLIPLEYLFLRFIVPYERARVFITLAQMDLANDSLGNELRWFTGWNRRTEVEPCRLPSIIAHITGAVDLITWRFACCARFENLLRIYPCCIIHMHLHAADLTSACLNQTEMPPF